MIVRPAEPGWPGPTQMPAEFMAMMIERAKAAAEAQARGEKVPNIMEIIMSGQDPTTYPDVIRDWANNGAASPYVMTPEEVIAASQPRGVGASAGAAHFELANHLWRAGDRDGAIRHFNECHRLQPDNWTYKRQAWSLVGNERLGGMAYARFSQNPLPGEEGSWPFAASFDSSIGELQPGQYYPKTISA